MKKKILVAILASIITLGCIFVGADYFKNHKINGVLSELEEAEIMIGNEIINNHNIEYYKNHYNVNEEQVKKYLTYVDDTVLKKVHEILNSAKYEHKEHVEKTDVVLGLMNKNDTISIYIYKNGDVLLNKDDKFYGYDFDKLEEVKKLVDDYFVEISNNPDFG